MNDSINLIKDKEMFIQVIPTKENSNLYMQNSRACGESLNVEHHDSTETKKIKINNPEKMEETLPNFE